MAGEKNRELETAHLRARSREVGIQNYMTWLIDKKGWKAGDAADYAGFYTRSRMGGEATRFVDFEIRRIVEIEKKYKVPIGFAIFEEMREG